MTDRHEVDKKTSSRNKTREFRDGFCAYIKNINQQGSVCSICLLPIQHVSASWTPSWKAASHSVELNDWNKSSCTNVSHFVAFFFINSASPSPFLSNRWIRREVAKYVTAIYCLTNSGRKNTNLVECHVFCNPITGLDRPRWFQDVEAPRFQDSRHMNVVRLSAVRTGRLYPPRRYSWYSFLLEAESTPGP